jgi:signal peptidase II
MPPAAEQEPPMFPPAPLRGTPPAMQPTSSTDSSAPRATQGASWRAILLFGLIVLLGLGVDLFTKWLAFDNPSTKLFDEIHRDDTTGRWVLTNSELKNVPVIPRLLEFHATVNEGAVFGLGQGKQMWFVFISVLAIAFLVYLVTRTRSRFEIILLGCLLAGVLGNMYDRVRYTYVRDMILALPGVHWPGTWQIPGVTYPGSGDRLVFPYIFNVADCLLVCGVAVLLIRSFFVTERTVTDDTDGHGLKGEVQTTSV